MAKAIGPKKSGSKSSKSARGHKIKDATPEQITRLSATPRFVIGPVQTRPTVRKRSDSDGASTSTNLGELDRREAKRFREKVAERAYHCPHCGGGFLLWTKRKTSVERSALKHLWALLREGRAHFVDLETAEEALREGVIRFADEQCPSRKVH